jgi:hypothetical protein
MSKESQNPDFHTLESLVPAKQLEIQQNCQITAMGNVMSTIAGGYDRKGEVNAYATLMSAKDLPEGFLVWAPFADKSFGEVQFIIESLYDCLLRDCSLAIKVANRGENHD